MKPSTSPGRLSRARALRRSPAVLFGIAAFFFVAMRILFVSTNLNPRLPMMRHGQITLVPAGQLVLLLGLPFAIFALIYGGIELKSAREFRKSATRIHLVCTFLAVVEAIRVYASWAVTTANRYPDALTSKSFGGAIAFVTLAGVAFGWNVYTSRRKPE